jgi:hypothetical protein
MTRADAFPILLWIMALTGNGPSAMKLLEDSGREIASCLPL